MPTDVVSSIGSASRDYSTFYAAESATDNDLVAADERIICEAYADSDFGMGITLTFTGTTNDETRYRVFKAADGQEFDPISASGVQIRGSMAGHVFRNREDLIIFQHLGIVCVNQTDSSPTYSAFRNERLNAQYIACTASSTNPNTATQSHVGFAHDTAAGGATGENVNYISCLVIASDGTTDVGFSRGFNTDGTSASGVGIFNCGVFRLRVTVSQKGISTAADGTDDEIVNTWSFDVDSGGSAEVDYDIDNGGDLHCASEDGSLPGGTGNIENVTVSAQFTDPDNNDFTIKDANADINSAGSSIWADVSGRHHWFGDQFTALPTIVPGVYHGDADGTISIGPYDTYVAPVAGGNTFIGFVQGFVFG